MADLQNFVKKAFYLGIGAASYAGEQANNALSTAQQQAQSIAEDMIRRGEMTADEARQWLDSVTEQNAVPPQPQPSTSRHTTTEQPRTIEVEILDDDEPVPATPEPPVSSTTAQEAPPVNDLHRQVDELEAELRRLQE